MDPLLRTIGGERGLQVNLAWPADSMEADLTVRLCGTLVWGKAVATGVTPVRWDWSSLVEHLARVWPYLLWEESFPLNIEPASPSDFVALARQRLVGLSETTRREHERRVNDFVDAHELSQGVEGLRLPPLWMVSSGGTFTVASGAVALEVPRAELIELLEAIGNAIVERAKLLRMPDARRLQVEWQSRGQVPVEEVAAAYVGATVEELKEAAGNRSIRQRFELQTGEFRPTALLAAARATANAISPEAIRLAIDAVREVPASVSSQLEALSLSCQEALSASTGRRPYEDADIIAPVVRAWLKNPGSRVNPDEVLKRLGIQLRQVDLRSPSVDALLVWGKRHGPVVLINRTGAHVQGAAGRRTTLAHELCHVLVDRDRHLPLAEALRPGSPKVSEVRARAFAAAFLLPKDVAREEYGKSSDLKKLVRTLAKRFGVSKEVVAWQLRNSEAPLSRDDFKYLRSLVSSPNVF